MENLVTPPAPAPLPTLQEIYDRTALHLLTQNRKSVKVKFVLDCLYRSPDGAMCAVGSWIKDEHYRVELEDRMVNDVGVVRVLVLSGVAPEPEPDRRPDDDVFDLSQDIQSDFVARLRLLKAFQKVHDLSDVEKWPAKLIELANDFSLSAAVVENFKGGSNGTTS
jgi:hypothetical protein